MTTEHNPWRPLCALTASDRQPVLLRDHDRPVKNKFDKTSSFLVTAEGGIPVRFATIAEQLRAQEDKILRPGDVLLVTGDPSRTHLVLENRAGAAFFAIPAPDTHPPESH